MSLTNNCETLTQPLGRSYTHRDENEAKTRKLFNDYRSNCPATHYSYATIIASAFQACWYSAMPIERVIRIGTAIQDLPEDYGGPLLIFGELGRMVRAKVLRSHVKQGKRLYEVNF